MWPRMEKSGNSKLLWQRLYCLNGHRWGTMTTRVDEHTRALGISEQAIRRAFEALENLGAVVFHVRESGRFTITLINPNLIPKSQPPGIERDPQGYLVPDAHEPRIRPVHPSVSASAAAPVSISKPAHADGEKSSEDESPTPVSTSRMAGPAPVSISKPAPPFNVNESRRRETTNLPESQRTVWFNDNERPRPATEVRSSDLIPATLAAAVAAFDEATDPAEQKSPVEKAYHRGRQPRSYVVGCRPGSGLGSILWLPDRGIEQAAGPTRSGPPRTAREREFHPQPRRVATERVAQESVSARNGMGTKTGATAGERRIVQLERQGRPMMVQRNLFDVPPPDPPPKREPAGPIDAPYVNGSETSKAAARAIAPHKAFPVRAIYHFLLSQGPRRHG